MIASEKSHRNLSEFVYMHCVLMCMHCVYALCICVHALCICVYSLYMCICVYALCICIVYMHCIMYIYVCPSCILNLYCCNDINLWWKRSILFARNLLESCGFSWWFIWCLYQTVVTALLFDSDRHYGLIVTWLMFEISVTNFFE